MSVIISMLLPARAATWYVDNTAGGTHNGTSWANAWTNLSQISGLSAGDTIYISGGASGGSQTYAASSWRPTGGTASAPITYQIGQDSAHNGTALFSGSGLWLTAPGYAVISGDAGDGKQHFMLSGYSQAANINGTTGLRLAYINFGSSTGSLGDGVDGQSVGSFELDHCYAYISSAGADHFMSVGFNGTTWDQNLIHDNTVYIPHQSGASGNGADGFQIGGSGYDLYNNLVVGYDTTYTGGQHQDGWQSLTGSYVKLYGNTFVNIGNYALFADAYYGGFNYIYVYNNEFLMGGNYVYPVAVAFGTDGGYVGPSPCTYNNIVIANNVADGFGSLSAFNLGNSSANVTTFANDLVENNMAINSAGAVALPGVLSGVISINNVLLAASQGATDFVSYSATGGMNNNFHLLSTATSLIGKGANLVSCFTTDMDGNLRAATGNWDIGPYAYSTSTPPANPIIQVNPGTIVYGTLPAGTSATNSIMVKNTGTGTLNGSATAAAPFNVVSGGNYSLSAGQTQAVVVVFSPVLASNYSQNVSFSGGGGTNVTVSGSVTSSPAPPAPTIVTEKVTASTTNPVTLQFCTNLLSSAWWTAGTFAGSTNLSFTNLPVVFIRGICSNLASSIAFSWAPSTSTSTTGYKVYYGSTSGTYSSVLTVGKVTTVIIPNLTAGRRYYFRVDTYNFLGITSPYTSETSATVPVTSFTLTIGH